MTKNFTIGIPKGLLYSKYHTFAEVFFINLGYRIVSSPDTNKEVLDAGVKHCVDDACLPIKVFHGHIYCLKDQCDYLLIPRFLSLEKRKFLCPMFCGVVEMVKSSISGLPRILETPVISHDKKYMMEWAMQTGGQLIRDKKTIDWAFQCAIEAQKEQKLKICDNDFSHRIALIGHSYLIYDAFVNMNLINKLHSMNIGIMTTDSVSESEIDFEVMKLYKQPFWYFAREYYGSAVSLYRHDLVDGIICLSSFSCGVDSVFIDLIRQEINDFPFMVLKIDEHTGEAAIDTRIEAFADMLKRRNNHGHYIPSHGQYMPCSQSLL